MRRTDAAGVLGAVTILFGAATAVAIGVAVERSDTVAQCEALLREDPPRRGCLNTPSLREQRDISIGVAAAIGGVALGFGIAWILAAVLSSDGEDTSDAAVYCAPGVFGIACAGRF